MVELKEMIYKKLVVDDLTTENVNKFKDSEYISLYVKNSIKNLDIHDLKLLDFSLKLKNLELEVYGDSRIEKKKLDIITIKMNDIDEYVKLKHKMEKF